MLEIASLIIVNLIIASIIGFLIGFIIGRSSNKSTYKEQKSLNEEQMEHHEAIEVEKTSEVKKAKTSVNPIFRKNSSVDNKPLILSSPRQKGKDNLKKIKGIDSLIEEKLNKLGIFHFDQVANWSNKNCDWIEEFMQISGCVKKFQWVEQAKILESGKETVYSLKVEKNEIDIA